MNPLHAPLDAFPEGILFVEHGTASYFNPMAAHYLPQLALGEAPPPCICLPEADRTGAGRFRTEAASYVYSCALQNGVWTVLFHPAPQTALTGRQMDGVLSQLRSLLGDLLSQAGPATASEAPQARIPAGQFSKTFHQMLRLTNNLDFLQQAAGERGVDFLPVTMDLAGLCLHVSQLAGMLLEEAGVSLSYESKERGLLIPGDPALLQRLLLGLISNAARTSKQITLSLRKGAGRARISLSGDGPAPSQRQLAALFQQGPGEDLPLPGQGAGLGLSIAHHIVELHRGTLLMEWGDGAPSVLAALPTGPLDSEPTLHAPSVQRDGGLDTVLLELSDLLPTHLFDMEGLE